MADVEPILARDRIRIADLMVDADRSELRDAAGVVVPLRPKALALLLLLASRTGQLVEREAILDTLWPGITVSDASLTQLVSELRRAMGGAGARLIRTVPKRGYILERQDREAPLVGRTAVAQSLPVRTAAGDGGARRTALAVLAFVPRAAALNSVARRLTGEVAAALARSKGLRVAVRPDFCTGEPAALDGAADPFETSYVLEGSVGRTGDLLRIRCRLSTALTRLVIWAGRFEYDVRDADVCTLLAQVVAGAVRPNLHAAELAQAIGYREFDRVAFGLYQRAIATFQGPASFGGLTDAEILLRHSLRSDPRCMRYRSAIAHCHALRHTEGWASPEQIEEATQIARDLIAHGASDPIVLSRAAFALAAIAGEHAEALNALDKALALAPRSYFTNRTLGLTHLYTGNWRGAFTQFERAGLINNNHPTEHCRLWGMAFASFGEGRYARSAELAAASLRLAPDFTSAWRMRAASLAQMGRSDEARTAARELLRRRPHFTLEAYRAERTWIDAGTAARVDAGLATAGIPVA